MPTCTIQSKPDMYGLGIRVAFYIQWFGSLAIEYLDESDTQDMRVLGCLLSGAMFIGMIIQVGESNLEAAEIYITLLLAVGSYLYLVPLFIWRGLTLCSPYWNPFRWNRERPSPIFKTANYIVLVAIASTATWYYVTFLPGLDANCSQYGFFFGPVSLRSNVYIAFNAILYIMILIVCAFFLVMAMGCEMHLWSKERRRQKASKLHIKLVRTMRALSNLVVFGVVVAAVELSVDWNNLDANEVTTAAQTIPLMVSAGFVWRTLFLYAARRSADDDDDGSDRVTRRVYRRETVEVGGPAWPPSAHTRR